MKIKHLKIVLQKKELLNISFTINSSLALVGESGSGKSLTLKALLGMLPYDMSVKLEHNAEFVLKVGENLAFIPQNPFTALSPLTKIKKQFFTSSKRVQELFDEVGLSEELLERFPPELSGGQLQRVVIAMALANKPKLLLLDEPTTALDPKTRVLIIELLQRLQKQEGFLMLFVTHDISSAKSLCKDICVIKKGVVVESGTMQEVINSPKQEYTRTLIEANFANRGFRV